MEWISDVSPKWRSRLDNKAAPRACMRALSRRRRQRRRGAGRGGGRGEQHRGASEINDDYTLREKEREGERVRARLMEPAGEKRRNTGVEGRR